MARRYAANEDDAIVNALAVFGIGVAGWLLWPYVSGRPGSNPFTGGTVDYSSGQNDPLSTLVQSITQPLTDITNTVTGMATGQPTMISANGIAFIKHWEGLETSLFNDAGHMAIGYGHDIISNDPITLQVTGQVTPRSITSAQADQILALDTADSSAAVAGAVQVPLTQSQFDALVSFEFNVGYGSPSVPGFGYSTLLNLLNQGDYNGAAQQFMSWIHSQGAVNQGLVNRRTAERNLFLTGNYG